MNGDKKKRERKLQTFSGKVIVKKADRDYIFNEGIFRLDVKSENDNELKEISVFQRKVSKEIWDKVISDDCIDKKYIFSCEKITAALHLKNWKELP